MIKKYISTLIVQLFMWGIVDFLWTKVKLSYNIPLICYFIFVFIYTSFFVYLLVMDKKLK